MAHPALELGLDQSPGLKCERHSCSPLDVGGTLAQHLGQPLHIAQQQEHRRLGGTLHLDVAAPGGGPGQPGRHPRIDGGVLEVAEQLDQLLGVTVDCPQSEGVAGPLERP